ncbi:uroporphyrinogen-III synthase [Sulfurihydrogenibium subterraneum]|uniref:uroporphyrinogen-III synthase n=1 Tax=Sulfurihydrogenibium subterraneum TaxID=171121 RepID=UPI0004916450|nr:uroporphyrinogen-III synthase [Sulfurihydrogenibium subterraneum]
MKNVLITREKSQFEDVKSLFEKEGFNPIPFPTIKFEKIPLNNFNEKNYDYLIFTSKNAVKFFLKDAEIDKSKPVIAVGSKTADYLRKLGFSNIEIPDVFSAEGLKEYIDKNIDRFKGKKFGLIRALEGSNVLLNQSGKNYFVELTPVYKTSFNIPDNIEEVENLFSQKKIFAVVFSSPSTFNGFLNVFGYEKSMEFLKNVLVCVIGTTTEKSLKDKGFEVDILPDVFTFEEIVKLLKEKKP